MKARRAPTHMAMAEMSEDRGEDALRVTVVEVAKQIGIDLKEKQLEALLTFCLGNDVFVSLPTGYGKSMIYGLLPLIFDEIKGTTLLCLSCSFISLKIGSNGSIVICISPLVAIMREQAAKFLALGIKAEFVGEEQTDFTARHRVINGDVQLVFISPENLLCNSQYRGMLRTPCYKSNLVAVAVDEAHCVKVW